jgi:hypothetical protein
MTSGSSFAMKPRRASSKSCASASGRASATARFAARVAGDAPLPTAGGASCREQAVTPANTTDNNSNLDCMV